MEYDPNLTAAYLAGKIDEYVKSAGRDTIKLNAARDSHARYARIPHGGSCDFCKMLGSRGFVYHSEANAGGDDQYHPFCNCQIAVAFDPFIDKYDVITKRGVTTVTRGYADEAYVVLAGRDGSSKIRDVDIDDLFAEYKDAGKDFNKGSRYRNYTRGARLPEETFDKYMKMLSDAKSLKELYEADRKIIAGWPTKNGIHDRSQWTKMSRFAKDRKKELEEIEEQTKPVKYGRSLSAAAKRDRVKLYRNPDGSPVYGIIAQGAELNKIKVLAGKGTDKKIRDAKKITADVEENMKIHVNSQEWQQYRGEILVEMPNGEEHLCEVHWFYSKQTGKIKFHLKKDFDDPIMRYQ